ncbi:hypothetical protein JRO89_XS13G0018400 [Xanthoceras sorbifolium]|uniref:non-specific serine/threonine protein kinase n=1 Tax=Xanthoceras sorbifolium TaxID=99658 RepID=A0ABQ8H5Z8_9ROSI|nr:hypothetical protein JRO89_XS13G0018400 [Xanthoceras sorbifolium]
MTCTRLKILLFLSLTQRSIITFFCILIVLPASFGDGFYGGVPSEVCTRTYICGLNTWGIWYPFWGDGRPSYCGIEGLELKCQNNEYPIIESETQRFRVSNIYTSIRRMTFSRDDLWDSYCPGILNETTFNKNLFKYTSNVTLLDLFYDCSDAVPLNESNSINCSQGTGFYTNPSNLLQLPNLTSTCKKSIEVPFLSTALQDYLQNRTDFQQALNQGFEVEFQADYTTCTQCFSSGGLCGSNTTSKFVCYCNDQPNTLTCDYSAGSGLMTRMKISIGIGAATAAITVICIICWLFRSKISSIMASLWKRENNDQDIEAIIRNYEPLAIKRYSLPEACSLAYVCGPATLNIWYPFWGNGRPRYCGLEGFELKCQNNQYPIIESGPQMFRVSKIDTFLQTMNMARDDIWNSYCPGLLQETTLNKTLYNYMPDVIFLDLFYNCSGQFSLNESNSFSCGEGTGFYTNPSYVLQLPNLTNTCEKSIKVPVLRTALENHVQNKSDFQQTLNQGFDVEFQSDNTSCTPCFNSGGVCASNVSTSKFVCYCRGQPQPLKCDHSSASGSNLSSRLKISIGATATVFGLTVIGIVSWLSRRKISSIVSSASLMKRTKDDQDLEAFIRNYGPLAIKSVKMEYLSFPIAKLIVSAKDIEYILKQRKQSKCLKNFSQKP